MTKDPAFLFYPGDWQLGTMHLTLLEKGCYMELLVLQFAKGKFTEAQAKHMLNGSFDVAWATLREKFDSDGHFFWNRRLELEKEKRKKFTDSRKSNGSVKKGAKHMLKHMENENENKNVLKEVGGEKVKEVANEVWKDEYWKESICLGLSISMGELKKWLAMFNSSVSSDRVYNFDKAAYKKMSRGWIVKQKEKGASVETNTSKKSDAPPLKKLTD
jgi:uncharacterized protein YdaU (DUF1376 family)